MKTVSLCGITAAVLCGFSMNLAGQSSQNATDSPVNAFQPAASYDSSDRPVSIAVGDFNKDGILDLAIANYFGSYQGGRVSILLGKGDGSFKPPSSYYSGGLSVSVATADFDRDGNLDLVVANENSADVSIFMGHGDGTFTLAVDYPAGSAPSAVVVGDFNGDGKPDLAVADANNLVHVLLGHGDGTFGTAISFPVPANPISIATGDFNGDGKLDLVVANHGYSGAEGTTAGVLMGNGDGTFQTAVGYPAGKSPRFVNVGDFNGDGKLDIVVASDLGYPHGGGAVLLGKGNGAFEAPIPYLAGSFPFAVAVADFDGDGKLDIIVANSGQGGCGNTVSVLMGKGDGSFAPAVNFKGGESPAALAIADYNKDHLLDVAIADLGSNSVSVLMGAHPDALRNQVSMAISGCWNRISQPGGSTHY